MKSDRSERPSLPAAIGMQCALLSLTTGTMALSVAFILWWRSAPHQIIRIGENAGLFSAAVGLILAGIGLASPRKRVRVVALAALCINLVILSVTLDTIFMFTH